MAATRSIDPRMLDPLSGARRLDEEIRAAAPDTERQGRASPGLLGLLREAGLFRMWLPSEVGGTEIPVPEILRVYEQLARCDGSTAWITMIGSGTNYLLTALPPEVVHEVFAADPDIATGGLLQPRGRATRVAGGYRVSGRWPFGSGCEHCSWMIGGALVMEGDVPALDDAQRPIARMFAFPSEAVEIHRTWSVSGLRGTGSHDYEVRDRFVPEEHAFALLGERSAFPFAHGRLPLMGSLAVTVAAVLLGMARAAVDALIEQVASAGGGGAVVERPLLQERVAEAEALVRAARAFVFDVTHDAWTKAVAGDEVSPVDDLLLRLASSHAARACTKAAHLVFTAAGTAALYDASPIQRVHRDILAAQQHGVVAYYTYEELGRHLIGMDRPGRLIEA